MRTRAHVSDAVVRRLPGYYRNLREMEALGVVRTSSKELGERMGLTASQIRQDFNCFGGFGQQGFGYHVTELKQKIGEILGLTKVYHTIIVGMGNIGRAVAQYPTFPREGFEIEALFDNAPQVVGTNVRDMVIQPMAQLEEWLRAHTVDIAILAVPACAAREVCERLVEGGAKAIWNFAPLDLAVPAHVAIKNVHLSDSLYALTFRMRENDEQQA